VNHPFYGNLWAYSEVNKALDTKKFNYLLWRNKILLRN
jgi:hypothetical protein